MRIDIGEPKPRQVLAGIARVLRTGKVGLVASCVVANLKPRKLRGHDRRAWLSRHQLVRRGGR